ncbi:MAG: hypothetical protein ACOY3E_13315 [Pseudomonadota bacterium]
MLLSCLLRDETLKTAATGSAGQLAEKGGHYMGPIPAISKRIAGTFFAPPHRLALHGTGRHTNPAHETRYARISL